LQDRGVDHQQMNDLRRPLERGVGRGRLDFSFWSEVQVEQTFARRNFLTVFPHRPAVFVFAPLVFVVDPTPQLWGVLAVDVFRDRAGSWKKIVSEPHCDTSRFWDWTNSNPIPA